MSCDPWGKNLKIMKKAYTRLKRLLHTNNLSLFCILLNSWVGGNSSMKINPHMAEALSIKVSGVFRSILGSIRKMTFYLWDFKEKNKVQAKQHE